MMNKCPKCGMPVTGEDVFCGNCGQRLAETSQPPQKKTVSPEPSSAPSMPGPPSPVPSEQSAPPPPPVSQATYQQPPSPPPSVGAPPSPSAYGQSPQPPKKKRKGCVIALIVAAVLVLCGLVVAGAIFVLPELISDPDPTATTVPFSGSSEAPLDVVNNLDTAICYLYISPSNSDNWGEDWLWEMGTIEPGFAATFYLTVGETVDMQAEDCNGTILDNQYNVVVPPEGLTYTLGP